MLRLNMSERDSLIVKILSFVAVLRRC